MFLNEHSNLCLLIILCIVIQISGLGVSYNQPKFCSNPSWNLNGMTFADLNTVGYNPEDIFINTDNTVFVPNQEKGQIIVLPEGSITPTRINPGNLRNPLSLFVTTSGDIFVDSYNSIGAVTKWSSITNTSSFTMSVTQQCKSLFVDISNTLYCSMTQRHQVLKKLLDSNVTTLTAVAGTGTSGPASNMLDQPHGIFVDTNFDLYVADTYNHRIQLFRSGVSNGITIAGSGSSTTTITLNGPTGIVLDADKNVFIADKLNNRIVGSGPGGFRCLVGCSGMAGGGSNQFNWAASLSFDSYGNMFVIDVGNNRIQKFTLSTNLCNSESTTLTTTTAATTTTTALAVGTTTTTTLAAGTTTTTTLAAGTTTIVTATTTKTTTKTMPMTTTLTTKIYIWPNSTSSASNYSHSCYFIIFLLHFNCIIMLKMRQ